MGGLALFHQMGVLREGDCGVQKNPQGDRMLCLADRETVDVQGRPGVANSFSGIQGENHGLGLASVHVDLHVMASRTGCTMAAASK